MTYPATKCFWLNSTEIAEVGLRRYVSGDVKCPGPFGYHTATTVIGNFVLVAAPADSTPSQWREGPDGERLVPRFTWPEHDDPRWPTACECGYVFSDADKWQESWDTLYRRADTGELVTLRNAPPGAMWDATWYPWKGPDGRSLVVKCPNGHDWVIDGRATNCTMPDDTEHRCWVRHGEPPDITVDKQGNTCAAGAGSIQAGDYHGFLRDGEFTAG